MTLRPRGTTHRKAIKYGTVKPASDLSDFPLLLLISSDTDIGAVLSATTNGNGIIITDTDEVSVFPFGIVNYNNPSGSADLAILTKGEVYSSSLTDEVRGYLYYGKQDVDFSDRSNVPDSNYAGFWPMSELPTTSGLVVCKDWTPNGYDLNLVSGTLTQENGVVAKRLQLDRDVDNADLRNNSFDWFGGSITVEALVYADSNTSGMFSLPGNSAGDEVGAYTPDGSGNLIWDYGGDSLSGAFTNGSEHYVALVHNVIDFQGIYVDGSLVASSSSVGGGPAAGRTGLYLFRYDDGTSTTYLDGRLSFFSLSTTDRSPDYIDYRASNFYSNSDTITFGVEEPFVNFAAFGSRNGAGSFSFTCWDDNSLLLIWVVSVDGTLPQAASTVTYNGVSATLVATETYIEGGGSDHRVELFQLTNPDTGAHNISVSVSGSWLDVYTLAALCVGVNQSTPLGTPVTSSSASTSNPHVSITPDDSDEILIACSVAGFTTQDPSDDTEDIPVLVSGTAGHNAALGIVGQTSTAKTVGFSIGGNTIALVVGVAVRPLSAFSVFPISVSDSIDISITETATGVHPLSITDTLSVSISDSPTILNHLSLTDSIDTAISETVSLKNRFQISESLDVDISDAISSAQFVSLSLSDTLAVEVIESVDLTARFPVSDTVDVAIAETSSLLDHISLSESIDLSITEAVSTGVNTPISVSDTVDVAVSETTTVLNHISATDTLDLSISEASSLVAKFSLSEDIVVAANDQIPINTIFIQIADTSDLSVSESFSSFRSGTVADTLKVRVDEDFTSRPHVILAEGLDVAFGDQPYITAKPDVTDSIDLSITESLSYKPRVFIIETLIVEVFESLSQSVSTAVSDKVFVGVAEALSIKTLFTLSESLDVVIADNPQPKPKPIILDTLDLGIADGIEPKPRPLIVDSLDISLSATPSLKAILRVNETLSLSVAESFGQAHYISVVDTINTQITEQLLNKITIAIADLLDVSVDAALAFSYHVFVIDSVDVSTVEVIGLVQGTDLIRVDIDVVMGVSEVSLIGIF